MRDDRPLKCGTWAFTQEWVLVRDTTVILLYYLIKSLSVQICASMYTVSTFFGERSVLNHIMC